MTDDTERDGMEGLLKQYLTVEQASRVLGVSKQAIRNWARQGLIRYIQPNPNRGKIFLRFSDVMELGEEIDD